jgi:hypothetical protein
MIFGDITTGPSNGTTLYITAFKDTAADGVAEYNDQSACVTCTFFVVPA